MARMKLSRDEVLAVKRRSNSMGCVCVCMCASDSVFASGKKQIKFDGTAVPQRVDR